MSPLDAQLSTTVYLVLEPRFGTRDWDGDQVKGFAVVGARKTRPRAADAAGVVVLALTIGMPRAAFEPLRSAVTITVPEGAYDIHPEVLVVEPVAEEQEAPA